MSKFFSVVLLIGLGVLIIFAIRRLVQSIKKFSSRRKKDITQAPITQDCSDSSDVSDVSVDSDQNINKEV